MGLYKFAVTVSLLLSQLCPVYPRLKKPIKAYYFSSDAELLNFLRDYDDNAEPEEIDPEAFEPRTVGEPIERGTHRYIQHVHNLHRVNGYKARNLFIRETNRDNPYMYMTNPIEANFPHPMIPVQDFKEILKSRIQLQKDIINERNRAKIKKTPGSAAQTVVLKLTQ